MKKMMMAALLSIAPLAQAELFSSGNSPTFFKSLVGSNMILSYSFLPLNGRLADDRLGWSESYWPSNKGMIAYRWNHPDPKPFKYKYLSRSEVMSMREEELGQLSPAELYDIAQGDYNFSLTKRVFSLVSPRDTWWEGICHGWAQAAINYPEPDRVTVSNPDGIRVPFGASDVKALLAFHEAYNFRGGNNWAFLGVRCKTPGKVPGEGDDRDSYTGFPEPALRNSDECRDVNAGAFHVVISNMIGIHGAGFVADIDRFNDVWNQPVTGYNTTFVQNEEVLPQHAAQGIARRVRVKTKMQYGEELKFYTPELGATGIHNFVSKEPVTGTIHQEFRYKDYEYIIELNSNGNVIGGEWISETRPDFMWLYGRSAKFKNSPMPMHGLEKIYRPVKR